MRVFLGIHEVCNITATYAAALQALGYDTLTAVARRNRYYPDSEYDVVLGESGQFWQRLFRWMPLVWKAISTCDLFIFTYVALTPSLIELPLLKWLGRRIVIVFWGSDVRYIDAFEEQMRARGVLDEYESFIRGVRMSGEEALRVKLSRVRMAEKYADLILSQPGYAQLQRRPYMRANIPLDLSRFQFQVPGRLRPLIVHAPSNPLIKGTDFIKTIMAELWQEGVEFDFHLVENMPNPELRRLLTSADIVVDELYGDTVGVLSTEGMATGNAVLTHYPLDFAGVPGDCPAVNITEKNLKVLLRKAIVDVAWRCDLAERGRRFVELHHDHLKVVGDILTWLESKDPTEYDFYPDTWNELATVLPKQ
jgi:hypothetical protein